MSSRGATELECRFCQVAAGEAPSSRVYGDDQVLAFMDGHPINPGHVLVIPTQHVPEVYRLDEPAYLHLMGVVRRIALAVQEVTQPKKVALVVAGFDVHHAHVHVIPMHDYHDITSKAYLEGSRRAPSEQDLDHVAEQIRRRVR